MRQIRDVEVAIIVNYWQALDNKEDGVSSACPISKTGKIDELAEKKGIDC